MKSREERDFRLKKKRGNDEHKEERHYINRISVEKESTRA